MPIERSVLERHVERLNARRAQQERVVLESFEPPGRFVLSFPNRPVADGECIDQDFSEIQFALHDAERIDTGIQGGRLDPATDRYHMTYEVVEWD